MRWLYRLQHHLALTQTESTALLGLVGLLVLGLAARHLQQQPRPVPAAAYEAADAQLAAGVAALDTAAGLPAGTPATGGEAVAPEGVLAEAAAPPRTARKALPSAPIDLNTATAAQLQQLPRIGPKMAERILAYREARGGFRSVRDLLGVKGIGEKTLAQIAPYVSVGSSP